VNNFLIDTICFFKFGLIYLFEFVWQLGRLAKCKVFTKLAFQFHFWVIYLSLKCSRRLYHIIHFVSKLDDDRLFTRSRSDLDVVEEHISLNSIINFELDKVHIL